VMLAETHVVLQIKVLKLSVLVWLNDEGDRLSFFLSVKFSLKFRSADSRIQALALLQCYAA
jgi:hypothetical protein